jgi:hypothetical protein
MPEIHRFGMLRRVIIWGEAVDKPRSCSIRKSSTPLRVTRNPTSSAIVFPKFQIDPRYRQGDTAEDEDRFLQT